MKSTDRMVMTTGYTIAAAPGKLPLLGHAWELFKHPLRLVQSLREHGDIVTIRLGALPVYVINHPDLIREMLLNDATMFEKGLQFDKTRPYIGNGLLTSTEPLHLRQRRLMQPAFHHTQIAHYAERMQEITAETINLWDGKQEIAMEQELFLLSVKVLTRALFSTNLDARTVTEFTQALRALLEGVTKRVALPIAFLEKLPTPGNRRFNAGRTELRAIIKKIIANYRDSGIECGDLLSVFLKKHKDDTGAEITEQQIHDEVMTMLIAGTETTANTLSWACHLLAQNPKIQERLQVEVDQVLAGQPAGVDDLPKLDYTQRVLTETLRLYPPTWLLSRRTIQDVELGGHRIAAGTDIFFSAYALHRDSALYPDPDRFDPDRWLTAETKSVSRTAYIPFGVGMRGCIGQSFAWTEMMFFLSTLAGCRTLCPVPNQPVRPIVKGSLQPNHLAMSVKRRWD